MSLSPAELTLVIDIGNNFTTRKYYSLATTTIFFYDYFLTLPDEVKYAWQGSKSWVFAIFLANRYLPVGFQIWYLYLTYGTPFHEQVLMTEIFTLFAQTVLTLRIYAVTRKNRIIASFLSALLILQLILGLYMTAYTVRTGSSPPIPIPLPVFMMCAFVARLSVGIAFTAMTLGYDVLAFSVIVFIVVRSNVRKVPIPGLLKTIVQDATYYFLVIFTSHFTLMMFLLFATDTMKILPAHGNLVFLPMMITRLLLSLKKAGASKEPGWSFGEPTTHTTMKFADRRGGAAMRDEIPLDTLLVANTQERTESLTSV